MNRWRVHDGSRRLREPRCWAALAVIVAAPVQAAPRVTMVTPPTTAWIVDGRAALQVILTFDVDVIVPPGGISVHTRSLGKLAGVTVFPLDEATDSVTVTVATVNADVMRIVANVSVADLDGSALDGDGDGAAGVSAIFQYTVLQGDVTRDGAVNNADLDAFIAALTTQNPNADLDGNGVVNSADSDILTAGYGATLALTDGDPPAVVSVVPEFLTDADPIVTVTFDEPMDRKTVGRYSLYALRRDGSLLFASGAPTSSDALAFAFPFADLTCDRDFPVTVDRSISDASGELLATSATRVISGEDRTAPSITCPDPVFVNSTTVYTLAAADYASRPALLAFLAGAAVTDECTLAASIEVTTSLDTPVDLPLGVNEVIFEASDLAGNTASCISVVIVVPAVPLQGDPGVPGADGSTGAPGADGADGAPGEACWDTNENGIADPIEDVNDDGVVNILDCRGADGSPGDPGGQDDPAGDPQPGDGGTASPPRGLCGAMGMISLLWMSAGLVVMRAGRRRSRLR